MEDVGPGAPLRHVVPNQIEAIRLTQLDLRARGGAIEDGDLTGSREGLIRTFGDEPTSDVYHGRETKAGRKLPKELWPVIRRKLDAIHQARSLQDLRLPAGNRLEALKGDRAGHFSIRVNERYRITFRFEEGKADDAACEDDH